MTELAGQVHHQAAGATRETEEQQQHQRQGLRQQGAGHPQRNFDARLAAPQADKGHGDQGKDRQHVQGTAQGLVERQCAEAQEPAEQRHDLQIVRCARLQHLAAGDR